MVLLFAGLPLPAPWRAYPIDTLLCRGFSHDPSLECLAIVLFFSKLLACLGDVFARGGLSGRVDCWAAPTIPTSAVSCERTVLLFCSSRGAISNIWTLIAVLSPYGFAILGLEVATAVGLRSGLGDLL